MANRDGVSTSPVRARNLLWLPVLGAAVFVGWTFGTPHLRISYVWSGDFNRPVYYRCSYWGLNPFEAVHPKGGDCPVLVLARAAS
jgi:hypothetical protein